jgi:adenylate cyclase
MGRRESGEQALHKSMANLERHLKMNPDDSWALGVGAVNLAELGDRERAIAWAERAIEASDEEPIIFYNSACTFAVLGEANRALDLLERAVALGWGDREWIQNDSDLASLHGNPRFRDVLGRIR